MAREKVNTAQFNALCHQLSVLSAVTFKTVVRSEVKSVLTQAVRNTPSINVGKVRARHAAAQFSAQPASLYLPKHGYKAGTRLTKNGFVVYYLKNRYPNALWNEITARRALRLQLILGARGLAKKSWDQIAEILGINLDIPDFVRRAIPSNQQIYNNVSATSEESVSKIQIRIVNAQPTINIPRVGGGRALIRAIEGRIKYFARNAEQAVFADIKKIASAYPGFKIRTA